MIALTLSSRHWYCVSEMVTKSLVILMANHIVFGWFWSDMIDTRVQTRGFNLNYSVYPVSRDSKSYRGPRTIETMILARDWPRTNFSSKCVKKAGYSLTPKIHAWYIYYILLYGPVRTLMSASLCRISIPWCCRPRIQWFCSPGKCRFAAKTVGYM